MKRKITTILLALALCLTLLPVGAGAASTTEWELKNGDTTLKYGNGTQYYDLDTGSYFYYDTTNACYVLNGGTYYLDSDVTITQPLLIRGTSTNPTILDLKGHVLKLNSSIYGGDAVGSVIVVDNGAHFTLQDSDPDAQHKLGSKSVSLAEVGSSFTWNADIYVIDDSGTAGTVTGGVITGGTGIAWLKQVWGDGTDSPSSLPTYTGGGVFVGSDATFKMTGGNIVGCTATQNGGGVALCSGTGGNETTFTMTGGRIVGCTALFGGGVQTAAYVDGTVFGSIFTLAGGTIQDCTAGQSGGGVYAEGKFIMSGNSTIEKCTAIGEGGFGGGVATGSNTIAEFTMKGGTIKSCTAGDSGGGVHHQGGTFTMEGGTITDCTAGQKGGGVCISGSSKPAMDAQGGSVDGGVYVYGVGNGMYGKLTNTSANGSTIFYAKNGNAIVKHGENAAIEGKQVKFMNGDTLYAETVAKDGGGKISEPVAPTKAGNHFMGWYTQETSGTKWEFTANTVSSDNTTLYAQWHTLNHVPAKTPAAGVKGNQEYWYCNECNAYFSDENGTKPTSLEDVTLDALPHRTYRTTATIESPKTADMGVALYALMALTSYTGTALVVRGRKRK